MTYIMVDLHRRMMILNTIMARCVAFSINPIEENLHSSSLITFFVIKNLNFEEEEFSFTILDEFFKFRE
jgi:hypothetical protein